MLSQSVHQLVNYMESPTITLSCQHSPSSFCERLDKENGSFPHIPRFPNAKYDFSANEEN